MPPRTEGREPPRDWWQARWKAVLALAGMVSLLILLAGNPLESWEREWFDQALRWRGQLGWTPPADPRIVILGIDDLDMAALPELKAEYDAVAAAISHASDLGAEVIAIDAIYVRGTPEMAKAMLVAVANGPPVVFAEAVGGAPGSAARTKRLRSFPFLPVPIRLIGLVNVGSDRDGIFRSYQLRHWTGKDSEPSLALAAHAALRGGEGGAVAANGGGGRFEQAADARLLNVRGSWADGAGFFHLTLRELRKLHADKAPEGGQPLSGKVIILSNTATGITDVGSTSFSPNQPLVLVHATALNDLLQDSAFRRTPRWGDALALLAVPALAAAGARCARKRGLLILWVIGSVAILATGMLLLFKSGWLAASISTLGLWTVATVLELALRHTNELAERKRVRGVMGHYFSPKVLNAVLVDRGCLAPKEVEVTVLLSDLRNSTPLTESLGAEGMLKLLNRIFAVQTRVAFSEDGSLENRVGDQFVAYWGAPEPQADVTDRAMRAALALIEGMELLRTAFEMGTAEEPPLEASVLALFGYGVALHAGQSLIGNIGSEQYFHYGLMGDLMNTTARVESLTKHYGVPLIITREVYQRLTDPPPCRVLDHVIVKGKTTPVELIEVEHRLNSAGFSRLAVEYEKAFAFYRRGEFAEAARRFEILADSDRPSGLMAMRSAALAANPPTAWSGVFTLENK